ncbi:MAG: DUF2142 domain-containing protein [Chloroflexi bacterium]|nr:DUF2142 domain-containing protein [Chloroflexota bacterium]
MESPLLLTRESGEHRRPFFLALIVALYLIFGFLYATGIPKWNTPDEPAHYNYIRQIATGGGLPILQPGDYNQERLERLTAAKFPPTEPIDDLRYEGHQPPLYYLLNVVPFIVSSQLSENQRVLFLRLLNVVLGAFVLLIAYALVRQIFPRDPLLALATCGLIAVIPMHLAVAGSITNDILAEVLLSWLLLLLVRGLHLSFTRERLQVIGLVLGLALLTKTTIYSALLLPLLALALQRWWPDLDPPVSGVQALTSSTLQRLGHAITSNPMVAIYGPALLISGWWFVRNALVYGPQDLLGWQRHAEVVVGQPLTTIGMDALRHFVTTAFKSFWAQFGWMGILVDARIYLLLAILSLGAVLGLGLFLWDAGRRRFLVPPQVASLLILGVAAILVLGQLVAYNLTYIQPQGRYLYPAIVPIALFFVIGVRELLAERHASAILAILYVIFIFLDFASLYGFILPWFAGIPTSL